MNRLLAISLGLLAAAGPAGSDERFWILWERSHYIGRNCPNNPECVLKREYASRPLEPANPEGIYRLFGLMGPTGSLDPAPSSHPDAPRVCEPGDEREKLGFDPQSLPQSIKIEALRGITALHVDLTGLRAPPGFSDSFGDDLHRRFAAKLQQAGIRIVEKNELALVDGQPQLNVYFSFTDPDGTCEYTYSVFASLTPEVLLARDLRIKISAGVWSYSTGSGASDHRGNEADAILRVADALIRDHRQVNPK